MHNSRVTLTIYFKKENGVFHTQKLYSFTPGTWNRAGVCRCWSQGTALRGQGMLNDKPLPALGCLPSPLPEGTVGGHWTAPAEGGTGKAEEEKE